MNRLLVFLVRGLGKFYQIPVAYFFSRKLTVESLFEITKQVIQEVDKNGSTHMKMWTRFSQTGKLSHQVPHPNDPERKFSLIPIIHT